MINNTGDVVEMEYLWYHSQGLLRNSPLKFPLEAFRNEGNLTMTPSQHQNLRTFSLKTLRNTAKTQTYKGTLGILSNGGNVKSLQYDIVGTGNKAKYVGRLGGLQEVDRSPPIPYSIGKLFTPTPSTNIVGARNKELYAGGLRGLEIDRPPSMSHGIEIHFVPTLSTFEYKEAERAINRKSSSNGGFSLMALPTPFQSNSDLFKNLMKKEDDMYGRSS